MKFNFLKHFTLKGSETGTEHGQRKKNYIYLLSIFKMDHDRKRMDILPKQFLCMHCKTTEVVPCHFHCQMQVSIEFLHKKKTDKYQL